ncbi:MAG: hypothetical protein QOG10_1580 [Kribbellaceae bacterium]|nr:hypothetical protein [Kribbellaceae bacterium]
MADQTGAARLAADPAPVDAARSEALVEPADLWSILDQAAADESITDARHRAVEPVPIVTAEEERPAEISDNQILANQISDSQIPGTPISGARRKWSPRPVPGIRRKRKSQQAVPATDMEPTPAEEMDVATHDDKAAAAAGAEKAVVIPVEAEETPAGETGPNSRNATATATKPARPQTAAEIVAAQIAAREQAAEEAAAGRSAADTGMTKPVTRQPAVPSTSSPTTGSKAPTGNPLASAKAAREKKDGRGKGKAAMSAVGSGVAKLRNSIASLVWLLAVLAAGVLALGALFTALDQTNQSNEIVAWILARGHELVGPFKDLFRLETAKNTLLVNWGIAALVYLIAGKIVERFVRP